jgi:type ISP restriction-modification system protein
MAELHVNYEQQPEYSVERIENGQLDWRVEKMRLSKDKTTFVYNEFLTLKGIPPETYEYRLGNRSVLEWVIHQYQVSTDKRSGITNDPNRADDPECIVRLVGQVTTVSLETIKIVNGLPPLVIGASDADGVMACRSVAEYAFVLIDEACPLDDKNKAIRWLTPNFPKLRVLSAA